VNANAQRGAGIGSGDGASGTSSVGNITIANVNIFAASSRGARIGAGSGSSGTSRVTRLAIINGNITAFSSRGGAGIGHASVESTGVSELQTLVFIGDSIVTAQSSISHQAVETLTLVLWSGSLAMTVVHPPAFKVSDVTSHSFELVLL
jgi:hypothetical protein